jgi:hypothetical protein
LLALFVLVVVGTKHLGWPCLHDSARVRLGTLGLRINEIATVLPEEVEHLECAFLVTLSHKRFPKRAVSWLRRQLGTNLRFRRILTMHRQSS